MNEQHIFTVKGQMKAMACVCFRHNETLQWALVLNGQHSVGHHTETMFNMFTL